MDYSTINIRTIGTDGKGSLSFFESGRDVPFEIRRIYYIYGVLEGTERGGHTHRDLTQMLWCPFGSIEVVLGEGTERESVVLDEPSKGLVIGGLTWREMTWREPGSVLAVAASAYHDESDYMRNYAQFLHEVDVPEPVEGLLNCWTMRLPTWGECPAAETTMPFGLPLRRTYYTYGVPAEMQRGGHAHRDLTQVLTCPHGSVEVLLDDGTTSASVTLDRPDKALVVGRLVWHDMIWHGEGSVLFVTASDYYDESDYIRDYDDFKSAVEVAQG